MVALAFAWPLALAPDAGVEDNDAVAVRDSRLVTAALTDPDAYRHLVDLHQARVYATALRLLGNESDARDAAQEAFLRGYRALSRFRIGCRFGPWICTIAANVARDQLRDPVRRFLRFGLEHIDREGPERTSGGVERSEREAELERALQALKPKLREAIVLRYVAELSIEEVASALGIGESAAKMRIKRGLERLSELLTRG